MCMEVRTWTGETCKNKTINPEGEFDASRDQMYFVLEKDGERFLLGIRDVLRCLRFAEKQGEIPKLPEGWWSWVNISPGILEKYAWRKKKGEKGTC